MTVGQLFFSSRGRIGRTQWWIGIVTVFVLYVSGELVGTMVHHWDSFAAGQFMRAALKVPVLYLAYCVVAKRCHDCDERPIWALAVVALGGLEVAWSVAEAVRQFDKAFIINTHLALLAARSALVSVLVVLLGYRRGTVGDNRYGPDPVAHHAPPQSDGQVSSGDSNAAR